MWLILQATAHVLLTCIATHAAAEYVRVSSRSIALHFHEPVCNALQMAKTVMVALCNHVRRADTPDAAQHQPAVVMSSGG